MDFQLLRLNPEIARQEFTCGDNDLDEFYRVDSIQGAQELLSVTYALIQDGVTIGFFSLLNDSIKTVDLPRSARDRLKKRLPERKRYRSMPAAKIGRIGVCVSKQRRGLGRTILDYLKAWFTVGNKTGCRFLLVDAYNQDNTTAFYTNNGFKFLTHADAKEETRIMYFDLRTFQPPDESQAANPN